MTRTVVCRLRPPRRADESGFSLVEVLVAVLVLAVLSLAVFSGLVQALGTSSSSRTRTTAAALAAQELDGYDAVDGVPTIPEGTVTRTELVGGRAYAVTTTTAWQPAAPVAGADRCAGPGTGSYPYLKVSVAVKGPGRSPTVRSETLLTPKAGTGPVDTATQRVRVLFRDGTPRSGITVTLAGLTAGTSPTTTATTDTRGCAVFTGLRDGSYRTSVNVAGHVGLAGAQTASRDTTISNLATPRLIELLYDAAVQIDVSLPVVANFPALPRATATVVNSGMQPSGQRVQPWTSVGSPAPPATTTRVTPLFPFVSGYQAWMGGCPDSDPVRHGRTRPLVTPAPGGAGAVTAPGGQLRLSVNRANTTSPVEGATVAAHDSCGGTVTAGTTQTGGSDRGTLKLVLPLGTWRFTVTAAPGFSSVTTTSSVPTSITVTGASILNTTLEIQ